MQKSGSFRVINTFAILTCKGHPEAPWKVDLQERIPICSMFPSQPDVLVCRTHTHIITYIYPNLPGTKFNLSLDQSRSLTCPLVKPKFYLNNRFLRFPHHHHKLWIVSFFLPISSRPLVGPLLVNVLDHPHQRSKA